MQGRLVACVIAIVLAAFPPISATAFMCRLPGAFVQGRIDGTWVGALLDYDGTPGSPHAATIYMTTMYLTPTPSGPPQGGLKLYKLGRVEAQGEGAAQLTAMFVNNKLYTINDRYAPGSNDKQYEYLAIQRFTIQDESLISEGEGILNLSQLPRKKAPPLDCSDADIFVPLRQVIESGALDRLWTLVRRPEP